jgi:DNA-binding Lrp family transcriptional regulator
MNERDQRLLNNYQRDFPLVPRPFAALGEHLGIGEDAVIEALRSLAEQGAVSRVGAVFKPGAVGASTLAAMAVPPERLDAVAAQVSAHQEVNHNYEREHRLNLWFVVTAKDDEALHAVIGDIERETGLAVLNLPMLEDYHLDLGFDLKWT